MLVWGDDLDLGYTVTRQGFIEEYEFTQALFDDIGIYDRYTFEKPASRALGAAVLDATSPADALNYNPKP